jgi:hypothetical protein
MEDVLTCPKCGHEFTNREGRVDPYAPPVGPIDLLGEDGSRRVGVVKDPDAVRSDASRALEEMEADRVFRQPSPYSGDPKRG